MRGADLAQFEGLWAIARRIEDRRAGDVLRFDGTATFTRTAEGLSCDEAGTLVVPDQPSMAARRRYRWTATPEGIAVAFDDGRPFHLIPPGGGAARHQCAADLYLLDYDFARWPDWALTVSVAGSRKDYTMHSRFRR